MSEMKVFDKWPMAGVKVNDPGIMPYATLRPTIALKTGANYVGNKFHKSRVFIVERLVNKLMTAGHKGKKHYKSSGTSTGKAFTSYNIVKDAFMLIEKKLNKNPVEVFVKALENAAPREEIVTIEYGGARYPKAVECAPQRRVDSALKYMVQGAFHKRFNTKKRMHEALAEEIVSAYGSSQNSNAIAKKLELERQADASR